MCKYLGMCEWNCSYSEVFDSPVFSVYEFGSVHHKAHQFHRVELSVPAPILMPFQCENLRYFYQVVPQFQI